VAEEAQEAEAQGNDGDEEEDESLRPVSGRLRSSHRGSPSRSRRRTKDSSRSVATSCATSARCTASTSDGNEEEASRVAGIAVTRERPARDRAASTSATCSEARARTTSGASA